MLSLNLPLYLQGVDTNNCVPCSLKSVIEYYTGNRISIGKLRKLCKTNKNGSELDVTEKVLKKYGLKFNRMKFKDFKAKNIRKALKKRNVVAICYKSGMNESHFSIITGLLERRGIKYCMLTDPFYGMQVIPMSVLRVLIYDDESWLSEITYA